MNMDLHTKVLILFRSSNKTKKILKDQQKNRMIHQRIWYVMLHILQFSFHSQQLQQVYPQQFMLHSQEPIMWGNIYIIICQIYKSRIIQQNQKKECNFYFYNYFKILYKISSYHGKINNYRLAQGKGEMTFNNGDK